MHCFRTYLYSTYKRLTIAHNPEMLNCFYTITYEYQIHLGMITDVFLKSVRNTTWYHRLMY